MKPNEKSSTCLTDFKDHK